MENKPVFQFGEFRLDARQRVLFCREKPVALAPKAIETLLYLVRHHGRLIEKEELMNAVWAESFVIEGNLTYHIRQLRKTLGDDAREPRFIETVARRGYRFIAEVEEISPINVGKTAAPVETFLIEPEESTLTFPPENAARTNRFLRRARFISIGILPLLFFSLAAIFLWQNQNTTLTSNLWASDETSRNIPFSAVKFQKIAGIGQAGHTAISPDGRLVAYTNPVGGRQSLWLRQLGADTNIQIIAPLDEIYYGLKFSRDGEYIYFVRGNGRDPTGLYRISVLGATATLIMKNAGGFSLSPDNRQIAYVRKLPENRCGLLISNTDAGNERIIAERARPNCYNLAAWSPDGKVIIASAGQSDTGDANTELIEIEIASGKQRKFSQEKWYHVASLEWLPDQSGLILTARRAVTDAIQLWQISYPNGDARATTNDATNYSDLSLTADGNRLLATRVELQSYLSTASAETPSNVRRITSAFHGLAWLPDGKIVYSKHDSGSSLWLINPDGAEQKQLTFDNLAYFNPVTSPDGQYIFYTVAQNDVFHIWRMNADGSNKIRITNGAGEQAPAPAPDGSSLFYQLTGKFPPTIWKIPVDGGETVQITKDYGTRPQASPDGKLLAYFIRDKARDNRHVISVLSLESGQIVKTFAPAEGGFSTHKIRWTPDGAALAYATETAELTANIWIQPLNGESPRRLTDFNAERIFDFAWSPDGKQLAVIRGSWNHEAVLISRNSE